MRFTIFLTLILVPLLCMGESPGSFYGINDNGHRVDIRYAPEYGREPGHMGALVNEYSLVPILRIRINERNFKTACVLPDSDKKGELKCREVKDSPINGAAYTYVRSVLRVRTPEGEVHDEIWKCVRGCGQRAPKQMTYVYGSPP
jgi:hypothetical protein